MASEYQSVFRPGLFAGQISIVTGAGSGIGRCTAHELAALGARVALIGRKAEKLEAVARETAALEWAPVRVNAIAPGWIASSGLDHYPPEMREHIRGLPKKVPLGRLGTESEVSATIVFLLSPAAAFISGSCIRIDGGVPNIKPNYTMPPRGATVVFDGFHLAAKPKVLE